MNCFMIAWLIIQFLAILKKITPCGNSFPNFIEDPAKMRKKWQIKANQIAQYAAISTTAWQANVKQL